MDGFALLLGHLTGDYLLQNDWMAANKTNALAGRRPGRYHTEMGTDVYLEAGPVDEAEWWFRRSGEKRGHRACTVHCLLYTLAVWAFSWHWLPWWGLIACFLAHWPIDRFRLARWWMENVAGQRLFSIGPLAPWSVIVVDQCFHLLTLYGIWLLS